MNNRRGNRTNRTLEKYATVTVTLILLIALCAASQTSPVKANELGSTLTTITEQIHTAQEPIYLYGRTLSGRFNDTQSSDGNTQVALSAPYTVITNQTTHKNATYYRVNYYYVMRIPKTQRNIVNVTWTVQGRTGNASAAVNLYNFRHALWANTSENLGVVLATLTAQVNIGQNMDQFNYVYIGIQETNQTTAFQVTVDLVELEVTYQVMPPAIGVLPVTLNPGAVVWLEIDLTAMNESMRCFGLPAIENNTGFAGMDWTGTLSTISAGNGVWLGAYPIVPPSGVAIPVDRKVVSPCIKWVQLEYIGQQPARGNFTIIISVGVTDPFTNAVWLRIPLKPTKPTAPGSEVIIVQPAALNINVPTLVTLVSGIIALVITLIPCRMYTQRHGHFQD